MYELEKIINEKINDEEKVNIFLSYFEKEFKLDENQAKIFFEALSKYDDIFNEFIDCIGNGNSYKIDNSLVIEGYSAKKIADIMSNFTPLNVYMYMVVLRDNPKSVKDMLDKQIKINEMNTN